MVELTTYHLRRLLLVVAFMLSLPWLGIDCAAQEVTTVSNDTTAVPIHRVRHAITLSDTARMEGKPVRIVNASGDTITFASIDSIRGIEGVEILMDSTASPTLGKVRTFNPDPQRALWMSALCPGLGQIYNRR